MRGLGKKERWGRVSARSSSKKIGMSSRPAQNQMLVTDLVDQNPVRTDVGIPSVFILPGQLVRSGARRQRLTKGQRADKRLKLLKIPAPGFDLPVIFEKTGGIGDLPQPYPV